MEMSDGLPRARVERAVTILPVREMERSIAFYEGLGFLARRYEGGGYGFLTRDDAEIHLRAAAAAELVPGESASGVYLSVSDADVLYEEWTAAGVRTLGEPEDKEWRMREFALSDPDGTLVRVGHPLPR